MSPLTIPITDHRAITHNVSLAQINKMELPSHRDSAAASELQRRSWLAGLIIGGIVITAANAIFKAIAPGLGLPTSGFAGMATQIGVTGPLIALTAMLIARRIAQARSKLLVEALLAESRCGICAQPLMGLAPEDDARTVCPECGAAWSVPPAPAQGPD